MNLPASELQGVKVGDVLRVYTCPRQRWHMKALRWMLRLFGVRLRDPQRTMYRRRVVAVSGDTITISEAVAGTTAVSL